MVSLQFRVTCVVDEIKGEFILMCTVYTRPLYSS